MAIIVERTPSILVSDQESGWSLTGGKRYPEGGSTKEMVHVSGARCTLTLQAQRGEDEILIRVSGVRYLRPGQDESTFLSKKAQAAAIAPAAEFYALAERLVRAWYAATFRKMKPIRMHFPDA